MNGPSPSFTYTQVGDYTVKVKIKNCVQAEITSASLTVHVTQTTPLAAIFQPSLFCQFQICFATLGVPVVFNDLSTGAQFWDYDWTHSSSNPSTCSFTDANHTSPVTSHTYATAGDYFPCLRVRRGASEQAVAVASDVSVAGTTTSNPAIVVSGTSSGVTGQAYTYSAGASNCAPAIGGWSWTVSDGTIAGASNGQSISVSWSAIGTKTVSVTNSGCSSARGSVNVTVTSSNGGGGGGGGTLQAVFTFSPTSPQPGNAVSFNGGTSTGSPTDYQWSFGDGATATGATATHAYTLAGSYMVALDVSKPSTGCPFAPCIADSRVTQTVVVAGTPPPPPPSADFTTSVTCVNIGGFDQCQAQTGTAVTFTAAATDATGYLWDFGDGTTATTPSATHSWSQAGSFAVMLTTVKGAANASKTKTFFVTGAPPPPPPPAVKSVVLPWIAQTRGALVQSSDLYIHNPSTSPITVLLEFRKRGLPETNPPQASKTIAAGATLYIPDVLGGLFNRANVAGFVSLTVTQGDSVPLITSYNTTTGADGKQFGQTIGGVAMSSAASTQTAATTTPQVQHLVGLISDSDRLAYFGISNPSENPATYHLRFFDKTGKMIAESAQDYTVSRFGQRQFQSGEIQDTFGISNQDDYRIEVESTTANGGVVIPYASNLRLASQDPSFLESGSSKNARSYLLGVLSAPGANNSLWQSDLLLSNIDTAAVTANVTFTGIGLTAKPTSPLAVTLQPGETKRLQNVVSGSLGVTNGIGLITVTSDSAVGVFPIVQGESYDNSNPAKRFGQSMTAISDADAAGAGQAQIMVGLRQDATHRTTFWLFNPGTAVAQYDIVYRALDGSVISTTKAVQLGAGKLRQFSPNQLPLPATGAQDGFTVQVQVTSGKVLSAAQVVNNVTNDPSYILGVVH